MRTDNKLFNRANDVKYKIQTNCKLQLFHGACYCCSSWQQKHCTQENCLSTHRDLDTL